MKKKKNIIIVLILVLVVFGALAFMNRPSSKVALLEDSYNVVKPIRQDIKSTLSGNGTLEAADSYNVTSLVSGDVLFADFEEGEIVEEDALLYVIDSSALENSIEQAEMSLEQSQLNYSRSIKNLEDLKIVSKAKGILTNIEVELGDTVNMGQVIASIRDQEYLTIKVPFIATEAEKIQIGALASITLSNTYESITGTVTKVGTLTSVNDANVLTKEISIEVMNPGALTSGVEAFVNIMDYASTKSGVFEWKDEVNIIAQVTGEVSKVLVEEGEKVELDQLLLVLSNDSLSNAVVDSEYLIRSSQMSLDKQLEALDDYEIHSPIAGTIVEKNIKTGDTLSEAKLLCSIFDMSYLTTVLDIDELDISKIQVDSKVEITLEALEGKTYEGLITRININGNTMNGVTTYPVTVRIDQTEGLLPGMNATFKIIVAEEKNALVIPIVAVERGNQVLLYTGTTHVDEESQIPEGYEYKTVELGISDDSYVEVLSGLEETDKILVKEVVLAKSEVPFGPGANGPGANGPGSLGGGAQ